MNCTDCLAFGCSGAGTGASTASTLSATSNVTSIPRANTYLSFWPHGLSRPTVSNLNLNLTAVASVLKITATTLGSTSSASKTGGSIVTSGSSYITDLSITAAGASMTNVTNHGGTS